MSTPWLGDACSLVEAFRAGELTPSDAVETVIASAESDPYNAICHIDADGARQAAAEADITKPFGGVPFAVKELEMVEGWPYAYGTKLLEGMTGSHTMVHVERIRDLGGAIPIVQTTSSEMGLVGYTSTIVHGTTTNPWDTTRTPGGSSGGTAAAVSGALVPIGTGTDGGGSIRGPAGYTGLVGFKTSFRRIPFAPMAQMEPLTSTVGCLSRSVRDTARWLDVANGAHPRDPFSLPRLEGFEAGLGSHDLAGLRVAVLPDFGGAVVHPDVVRVVEDAAAELIAAAGLKRVDIDLTLPDMGAAWVAPALPIMWAGAGPFWPDVREMVTTEVAAALDLAASYDIAMAAAIDPVRKQLNEAVATLFEQADVVLAATCPDDAFTAEGPSPSAVDGVEVDAFNTGRLTMAMNITGLPAISVPAGLSPRGLPIGMQIVGMRHADGLLLDLAALLEQVRPWPLVAPAALDRLKAPTGT
ncbi:MAG TPA: amidase [Mycobacteriales bacterium]|jgi:aspartyl-tRNA(Asn)/glutamyl-tRNA(Gln) amidotransferase subunit A|nr:amidase [Mycobacteriales bacterium]HVX71133.1 amidase [Mycobacteriales bacterium]